MKTIQKLRLINWHYFTNITADIKNITFLTGPNGTGKSTIIDALQIIILGTTRPDNFNKAANEKGRSGRNLISYLRGQTGVKDDNTPVLLRKGVFTSYIAIELYDDVKQKCFTMGACFDVDASDKIDKHYFYLDSAFPENNFLKDVSELGKESKLLPMSFKDLSAYVKDEYKVNHFAFFDTDTEYQNFAKEAFGNLPDKYFALFKKAVAFAPISNISTFITEYICDEDLNVDIEPMRKNIEQYKILENEAKNLKEKVESLTKIHEIYENYSNYGKRSELLNYVNARVNFEDAKKKLETFNSRLKKDNERLSEIEAEFSATDVKCDELNRDLNSYNAKLLQSDNYSLTEKLTMKKDQLTQKIASIQMQMSNVLSTISSYCNSYSSACSSFYNYYRDFDSARLSENLAQPFTDLVEIAQDISYQVDDLRKSLNENQLDDNLLHSLQHSMEELRNQAVSVKSLINNAIYSVAGQLQDLQADLNAVNQGQKPFDKLGPAYLAIKKDLENALKSRHSDAYVHIYCDLIDVNDPEWTLAIEAAIMAQKFNFFVNPAYYEEADRIVKELVRSYHYTRISLIDSERLINSGVQARDDSVARLIDTDDRGARAYTDYLLGHIKKCRTFQEARASGSGLLSDCTGYRNYGTWYLNADSARIFYIGTKVSDNTKSISSADYQKVSQTYSLLTDALNRVNNLLSLPLMSQNELASYKKDLARLDEIDSLQSDIVRVDEEMHSVVKGDMSLVQEKISSLNEEIAQLEKRKNALLEERGSIVADTKRLNGEEIPQADRNMQQAKAVLDQFDPDLTNEEYEPFFNKLLDELTLSQINTQAISEAVQVANMMRRAKADLIRLRENYCAKYRLSYDTQSEKSNAEFDKELENISKVMLPDYEEKISKAHEESIREFKDDFVYKLRTAIETVKNQIDELNTALKDSHFGRDSYQFKVSPNRDYQQYYDMIMDPLLLRAGDAENLFMEKYRVTMNDLFNLISSSTSASGEMQEQIKKNIELFTKYTTYIIFDLLVTRGTGDAVQTTSLAKSFTSQSGGETQTPFYISILASFAQLCRVNNAADNNTLRLVIFDEAFSKMDSARIMKSTDLLRQFGLQAILSTPSEKLRDLVNYVDLILVTIHDDRHKKSYIDIYQDKLKAEKDKEQ